MKGIAGVEVDTTARAVIRAQPGGKVTTKALDQALKSLRMSARDLKSRKVPVIAAVYQVKVKGMG